jgi:hypothetical protein
VNLRTIIVTGLVGIAILVAVALVGILLLGGRAEAPAAPPPAVAPLPPRPPETPRPPLDTVAPAARGPAGDVRAP